MHFKTRVLMENVKETNGRRDEEEVVPPHDNRGPPLNLFFGFQLLENDPVPLNHSVSGLYEQSTLRFQRVTYKECMPCNHTSCGGERGDIQDLDVFCNLS